jgi:oligopeptidase B
LKTAAHDLDFHCLAPLSTNGRMASVATRAARRARLLPFVAAATLAACASVPDPAAVAPQTPEVPAIASLLEPPVAAVRPHTQQVGDVTWDDPYYWLRERDNPEVLAYLEAENAYTEAAMAHTATLQETLYDEMLGRIQETDLSVPYRVDDYYYYSRTEEGRAYAIFCRRPAAADGSYDEQAAEEVLLDQNTLIANEDDYLDVGDMNVSPDHAWLAYTVDDSGAEEYDIHVRDLASGEDTPQVIEDVTYPTVWANDNRTLFYTTMDEAHRPYRLWRYRVGDDPASAELLYEETDERFFLWLEKSRSEAYIFAITESAVTSEVRYLAADDPDGAFTIAQPRVQGVEYRLEHHGESFYITTNRAADGSRAVNFRLVEAPVSSPGVESWVERIPHRDDVQLVGVDAFADYLVISERAEGLPQLRVWDVDAGTGAEPRSVAFPEATYSIRAENNPEFETDTFRLTYTSLVAPRATYDLHLDGLELELLKETPVLGGYDRGDYVSERIWATAEDGVRVPISVVYRAGTPLDGSAPMYLTGYGAYGYPYDAYFSSNRLSLLDRGFVFAIAHIRGGGELGRTWYEDGKFLNKRNTFTDFIACAEHLVEAGYTSPERLAIAGGSAGGLLMGAVTNLRPDLFAVVVADVPFVDVMNTMLDPTIPLTVTEWEEWGNPTDPEYFEYMLSYSPYDNVAAVDYPDMLITAGLNDPRVQYWEPAKWTARLRATAVGEGVILLKTNMGAGHFGASGRYGVLRELAFEYAFVLDRLGVN